ncbi:hypothetical protein BPAE_0071g00130 [Botrytis paeoniae]|uniref:Uncharacterized protein n=1 Tax=Botrytis paeoniae TaxID=278948 RepID=A0A4Z1FSF4_9HELO|nr:hypothetical protein BPAE_0071g00130 [Botrytis paeoniae]
MPAVTRSKSPSKKAPADRNQASSAADTSTNVAPVANMQAPAKEALAGANNALSDAMVPTLAPLSPSKRKRSANTISGNEGVGAQPSEPMKRTRVERIDAPRSRPTSSQPDLAATTYSQVERVALGLEDTPVFGTAGGAPKEGADAESSTPTSSPKPVKTRAAAPVLVGEENGVTAKAPISAVTVTAGQADDETVVEQPSPHPAANPADLLTANEAEAHLPAAPQGCSSSDLKVAKEELGAPKIGITNKCKCDKFAAKVKKIAELKADLRESQAIFQRKFKAAVEETNAIEIKEKEARKEYNSIRKQMVHLLESAHKLRLEREVSNRLAEENRNLSELNDDLKRENERLAQRNRELLDSVDRYHSAVDILNTRVPHFTSDQQDLERTRELLRIETEKTAVYEDHLQDAARFFAADEVVDSIETVDPAQGGVSHDNHNHEEHAQEDRSRRYRTPTPDNNGDNIDDVDVDDDDDNDDANDLPLPKAPAGGVAGTQQSHRASNLVGFRESSRWECLHDRGYNGNTCRHCGVHVLAVGDPEFGRDRSVTPTDELPPNSNDEEERNRDSASYEPAEAVINTQDESQQVGSLALPGNENYEDNDQQDESQHDGPPDLSDDEYYENENQQDHQESPHPTAEVEKTTSAPHPAAEVEKTTSAPSESRPSSSPSPSSSKKRKESPVSASSPANNVKSTETELAGPSSTAAPRVSIDFKPANPGWGSPSVLSPQVAVTPPAPSTSSSASESTTAAPLFPTVITRSGAAVQFGAATTIGAIGTAGSSVHFGSTHSFGVPALSARNPSVSASSKEDDAEEDKPADEKK